MGRYIVRLEENKYVHYSSVVDAPISYIMNREQIKPYMMKEDGQDEERVEQRLVQADKTGTSAMDVENLNHVATGNRAGPKGENISLGQMVDMYANEESYKRWTGK